MAPSNPTSCKKCVRCTHQTVVKRACMCVCVCMYVAQACQVVLTLDVTLTPDSKLLPVAKQPGLLSHQKLPDINILP